MRKNIQNVTFRGQVIKLQQLKLILPNAEALVIRNFLYYLKNDPYLYICDETICVCKSLVEWCDDLEIVFKNGSTRRMAKSTLCQTFTNLIKIGLVKRHKDERQTAKYSLNENNLAELLKKRFPQIQLNTAN